MTVIAWDGKTLAADKRATYFGLSRTVTKIFRVGDVLVALAGNGSHGLEMLDWIRNGCKKDEFPAAQRAADENQWATVSVFGADGIRLYERTPFPAVIEDENYATGSGRDYAIAAMHCGKTAREAVEIACMFETSCGNGIDTLTLGE